MNLCGQTGDETHELALNSWKSDYQSILLSCQADVNSVPEEFNVKHSYISASRASRK